MKWTCNMLRSRTIFVFLIIVLVASYFHLPRSSIGQNSGKTGQLQQKCDSKRKFYFVHIPKTGGTTIGSIFNRLLVNCNLTMPVFRYHFPWPDRDVVKHIIPRDYKPVGGFDVNYKHAYYNKSAMLEIFGGNVTIFKVTMLRHPLNHLKSLFHYANLREFFGIHTDGSRGDALEQFLQQPDVHEKLHYYNQSNVSFSWTINFAANFFMGEFLHSSNGIIENNNFIQFVDNQLDLVMISEYFDESLVLFKEKSGLSFNDIIYVKLRESLYPNKHVQYKTLQKAHQNWTQLDYEVYKHFSKQLLSAIENHGSVLQKKISEFKTVRRDFEKFCSNIIHRLYSMRQDLETVRILLMQEFIGYVWQEELVLTGEDCVVLALGPDLFEMSYYSVTYKQTNLWQFPCLANSSSLWVKSIIPLDCILQNYKTMFIAGFAS